MNQNHILVEKSQSLSESSWATVKWYLCLVVLAFSLNVKRLQPLILRLKHCDRTHTQKGLRQDLN